MTTSSSELPRTLSGFAKTGFILGLFCAFVLALVHTRYIALGYWPDVLVLHGWMAVYYVPLVGVSVWLGSAVVYGLSGVVLRGRSVELRRTIALTATLWVMIAGFASLSVLYRYPFDHAGGVSTYREMLVYVGGIAVLIALCALPAAWLLARVSGVASRWGVKRIGAAVVAYAIAAVLTGVYAGRAYTDERDVAAAAPQPERVATNAKIVEIGFDGADWLVLGPMVEAGELPHFARLIREGASGPLHTLPEANSAIIWNTIHTGLNRDKHAVLDFYTIVLPGMRTPMYPKHRTSFVELVGLLDKAGVLEMVTVNASMSQVRPVWDILSGAGLSTGVLGGYMNWPGDAQTEGFNLAEPAWPRYRRGLPVEAYGTPAAIEDFFTSMAESGVELETELAWKDAFLMAYLEAHAQPDFLQIFIHEPDMVQHGNWSWIEPEAFPSSHVGERNAADDPIRGTYRKMDAFLGRLLAKLEPDTNIIILSDHGFGATFWHGAGATGMDIEGSHRWGPPGIAILHGPAFTRGVSFDTMRVQDVTPTILDLAGLPVGADMDGRSVREVMTDSFRRAVPERRIATWEYGDRRQMREAAPDNRETLDELKSLGYL